MKPRVLSSLAAVVVAAGAVALAAGMVHAAGAPALADEDGSPVSIGTYRVLHSQVLGEDRTLLVNLPKGYDESGLHYPVLYVLYGGQVRGYFAEAVHIADRLHEASLVPQLIIVGVKNVDRYRDTLPVDRSGQKGGAERFLKFFTDELIPFVDGSYRTKDFRILVGPQAGASFSLYAIMERPGLFQVNLVTNPFLSPWVRDYLIERSAEFFGEASPAQGLLFVTCESGFDSEATMEYLNRLSALVDGAAPPEFTMLLNPLDESEIDGSLPSPGVRDGLKTFFKAYRLPDDADIEGLEDIKAYYLDVSGAYGYEVDIPEVALIRSGDRLQRAGRVEEARLIYEYVVEEYPHNLDSYHRLAELHRATGGYEQAIHYYEEFLARRNEPFLAERLARLRRYVDESAAYAVEKAILESGAGAGVETFREIRSDPASTLYFDEREFNALGYSLAGRGMHDEALEVFKMNVDLYPESANAYDSLGEAYLNAGDEDAAVENYRMSLKLNPENANARKVLEELGR